MQTLFFIAADHCVYHILCCWPRFRYKLFEYTWSKINSRRVLISKGRLSVKDGEEQAFLQLMPAVKVALDILSTRGIKSKLRDVIVLVAERLPVVENAYVFDLAFGLVVVR